MSEKAFRPFPSGAAALAAALLAAASSAHAGAPRYHLTRIDIPGAQGVYANDINDAGQVVGYYIDENYVQRPFLWDASGVHALALPTGADPDTEVDGYASAINDAGQIVGYGMVWDESAPALLWNAADPSAYQLLSDDPTLALMPYDISDNGIVVGLKSGYQTGEAFHGFVWTADGGVVDYGTTDTADSSINASWNAVNDAGQLVGSWNYQFSAAHASVGTVGTPEMRPLSAASDAVESGATAINAAGVRVGYMDVDGSGDAVPVMFGDEGSVQAIPGATLGLAAGQALGVNDDGVVVGRADDFSTLEFKAFVYVGGQSYDLYAQVDDSAGFDYFLTAKAVNASGAIVGTARYGDLQVGAYLATPIADDAIFSDGFDPAAAAR
ncbi:MAG TPA: hypothetical protein VGC30_08130 [Dokdonella sp.]